MLSKQRRIQLTEDLFHQFQRSGKRYCSGNLTALTLSASNNLTKFGVLVPKKLDKRATGRNQTRRVVFKVIYRFYPRIKAGKQILIQAHNLNIKEKEVERLLVKMGLLMNE